MHRHRVFHNLEDMLDWQCSAKTLRQECEERAWDQLRYDPPEGTITEAQVDGQRSVAQDMRDLYG